MLKKRSYFCKISNLYLVNIFSVVALYLSCPRLVAPTIKHFVVLSCLAATHRMTTTSMLICRPVVISPRHATTRQHDKRLNCRAVACLVSGRQDEDTTNIGRQHDNFIPGKTKIIKCRSRAVTCKSFVISTQMCRHAKH